MRFLIIAIFFIGFVSIAGSIIVGQNVFDGLVVDKPYETGLLWDKIQREKADERPVCDLNKSPCSVKIAGGEVILDITPKPVKAMKALIFTAVPKNIGEREKFFLDLGMPGMYMGENRIVLRKGAAAKYSGEGVIPRCPSGKKLWRATIEIPAAGKADFFFDVSY